MPSRDSDWTNRGAIEHPVEAMRARSAFLSIAVAISLAWPSAGEAPPTDEPETDFESDEVSEALSGREIYERYVEGRTRESFQKVRIVSVDPGGSEQLSRFDLRVQDARDENGAPTNGVRWRTRIDVHDPFDLRHTRYLIITNEPGPDDQFVYQPSARRVRRVDLSNTSFLGTDYSFGDIAVATVEDADHVRLPDEEIDGEAVYVVETRIKEAVDVEYRKTVVYLEQEHYLPLRSRSWDDDGVEVKEMTAPASKIREFGGVWVNAESTMRNLPLNTHSTLFVDELEANPKFNRATFSSGRLARGR